MIAVHDVNVLDRLLIEPAAFYVMDRAHLDYHRLRRFTAAGRHTFGTTIRPGAFRGMAIGEIPASPTCRAPSHGHLPMVDQASSG
jgi:hypothetical protein